MQIAKLRETGNSAHTNPQTKPDTIGSGSKHGERISFHEVHEK